MPTIDPSDFTDAELTELLNTPAVRMAIACRQIGSATREIQADEQMFNVLLRETLSGASRISSRESVENIVVSFLDTLEYYGGLGDEVAEQTDTTDSTSDRTA